MSLLDWHCDHCRNATSQLFPVAVLDGDHHLCRHCYRLYRRGEKLLMVAATVEPAEAVEAVPAGCMERLLFAAYLQRSGRIGEFPHGRPEKERLRVC